MADAPGLTPSQTVGPYLAIGLLRGAPGPEAVPRTDPRALVIRGRVVDGNGDPVPDGMVETWQANAAGRYRHPVDDRGELPLEDGFLGFARSGTDADGVFEIVTLKPGRVPAADGVLQAPHLAVAVLAHGLLRRLATRLYFPDEEDANASDPLLARLSPAERATLVARPDGDGLRFDVRLQGPGQTTFLAL